MKQLWAMPTPRYYTDSLAGINNSVVVLTRTQNNGDSTTRLLAFNPHTGARSWQNTIKATAAVCALTGSQLVVLANDQLAFLNPATGAQTSYETDNNQDASGTPDCPTMLSGGVSGVGADDGGAITVMQLASP